MFFEKYQFFLEIAKNGSVSKAAEKLMISQSALSKYLRRLEDTLGVQLFNRKTQPMTLTSAGEVFLRYVTLGVDSEAQCLHQIAGLRGFETETLHIGIGRWRGSAFLPQILPLFQDNYPFIKLKFVEGTSDFLADQTAKGKIDICILGGYQSFSFLEHIPLADEKILFVGNSSHPLIKMQSTALSPKKELPHIDIAPFSQERLILTSTNQGFAQSIENYFAEINFNPSEMLRIENLTTGVYLAARGNYFAFVPEIATVMSFPGNLSYFSFGSPTLTYPIAISYRKGNALSTAAKLFIDAALAVQDGKKV